LTLESIWGSLQTALRRSTEEAENERKAHVKTELFSMRSSMPVSAEELFRWHARPGALERLTPPWEPTELVSRTGNGIEVGAQVAVRLKVGPIWQKLVAEHTIYEPYKRFRDVMTHGPFSLWQHTHITDPDTDSTSFLEDQIEYALPMGALGRFLGGGFARGKLQRAFAYRHKITLDDLLDHQQHSTRALHIAITGASGLIGARLIPYLTTGGHRVTPIVRDRVPSFDNEIAWNPAEGLLATQELEGVDAVIHLAGEPIAEGRWTSAKKEKIKSSRMLGTRLLAEKLASMSKPPKVLISASAIGIYGDRKDEALDEESSIGEGFLADVCKQWEEATQPARDKGIRVVNLRIGLVLSLFGGLLPRLLTPFRAGVGGKIGDGKQWMSWISLDDLYGVILRALADEELSGPVNAVASSCRNEEFTKVLAGVLSRPSAVTVPEFALRAALGEAADEAVLASAKVTPKRLQARQHRFRSTSLEDALRHTLGR
jgi:uncharacterized protein (TIGR01777 family)